MNKFQIKESFDNFIYSVFNFITDTTFLSNKNLVSNNARFKDLHKGERCFILGTGPSLKNIDLALLSNEVIFGVNYLYKFNNIEKLSIDYYVLYDEVFYDSNIKDTLEVIQLLNKVKFFMRINAKNKFSKYVFQNRIYYQNCKKVQYSDNVEYDMTKNMSAPFNVLVASIQIALYMGFKEIYLLGADFNSFANTKSYHCYSEDSNERKISLAEELKFYSMVTYHHYALNIKALKCNSKIVNLTEKSLLDAYPIDSLSNILKDKELKSKEVDQ